MESFVSFDKSLTNSVVVDELKKLSGDLNDDDEDQDEHDPGLKNFVFDPVRNYILNEIFYFNRRSQSPL